MHTSLTLRTNIQLIVLYATILGTLLITSAQQRPALLLGAFTAGLIAGALQAHALRASPDAFRAAQTWAAVRAELWSSVQGKASVILLWCNGLASLALLMLDRPHATPATALAVYTCFGLARELGTFRAVRALAGPD